MDIELKAGDSYDIVLTVTEEDGSPTPLNEVDVFWFMTVAWHRLPTLEKTLGQGVQAEDGEITITVDPADTAALRGDYWHQCRVRDAIGQEYTVASGKLSIKPSTAKHMN